MTTDTNIPAAALDAAVQNVTPMPGGQSDFTPEQIATMAGWAVEDGSMTREQADAALKLDDQDPLPAAPASDPVAAEIDAAFPAAKPGEYVLPPYMPEDAPPTKEMIEFDGKARGWLATAELPKGIGDSIAAEVGRVAAAWEKMNPTERELWTRTEQTTLANLWGDQAEAKLNLARQLVRELEAKAPGVVEMLELTGAGNSAVVTAHLALQAERLAAKRGGRRRP